MCVSHINTCYIYTFFSQAHPTHKSYRTYVFADYEDLQTVVGNGTAVGRHSIGLGDDTDARTFGIDESISSGLDDLTYDYATGAFIEIVIIKLCMGLHLWGVTLHYPPFSL